MGFSHALGGLVLRVLRFCFWGLLWAASGALQQAGAVPVQRLLELL